MAFSPSINDRLIKLISLMSKDGKIQDVEAAYGQKWSDVKTENEVLNSIFEQVDDGNNIIEAKELNLLNKIFLYIDSLKNKNNGILEQEELEEFTKLQKNGQIDLEQISKMEFAKKCENWSEGLERNIKVIKLNSNLRDSEIHKELEKIGEEQGFVVEFTEETANQWLEDSSIRRHDGKVYVPYHSDPEQLKDLPTGNFKSEKGNTNAIGQGNILELGFGFDVKVAPEDKHYGTSYLEGGNVLNTRKIDGTPAALVGETSIGMTLELMDLENTPENVELVKKLIAEDLGLQVEDVAFIPQHAFHIDMSYRPLQNGKVAIPDYEEGVKLLTDLYNQKLQTGASDTELEGLKQKIENLKVVMDKTNEIRKEASEKLVNDGYQLLKLPCFTVSDDDKTNFMNGIAGTSEQSGKRFYITNKSEYPELDSIVEKYIREAGIDTVYYVSSTHYLSKKGGIDCLTQEQ